MDPRVEVPTGPEDADGTDQSPLTTDGAPGARRVTLGDLLSDGER